MEKVDYLEQARSRYTDQHIDDPVFDVLVQLLINQCILNQDTIAELSSKIYDINLSEGFLLDIIGLSVGQDRVIEGKGEFFGFQEDVSASGYGDIDNDETGGYWYSLYNGSRTVLTIVDDEVYRRLIKARIIYNNNLATPETLLRILNLLTNTTTSRFTEDDKGNVYIYVDEDANNLITYFLSIRTTERNLIPIPLGVSVGLNIAG